MVQFFSKLYRISLEMRSYDQWPCTSNSGTRKRNWAIECAISASSSPERHQPSAPLSPAHCLLRIRTRLKSSEVKLFKQPGLQCVDFDAACEPV